MTATCGSFDTLLLDMDGVIVDSVSALKSLYYEFLRRRGCAGSEDEFTGFNGRKLEEIVEAMRETYALPQCTADLLEEYRHDMLQVHDASNLVPGASAYSTSAGCLPTSRTRPTTKLPRPPSPESTKSPSATPSSLPAPTRRVP